MGTFLRLAAALFWDFLIKAFFLFSYGFVDFLFALIAIFCFILLMLNFICSVETKTLASFLCLGYKILFILNFCELLSLFFYYCFCGLIIFVGLGTIFHRFFLYLL